MINMFQNSLQKKVQNFLAPKYTDSQILLITIFFVITFGIQPGNKVNLINDIPMTVVGVLYMIYVIVVMFKKGIDIKHYKAIHFIGILMIVPMTFFYVGEAVRLLDFNKPEIHNFIFIFYALPVIIRFLLYLTMFLAPQKSIFSLEYLLQFVSGAEKQNVGGLLTVAVIMISLLAFDRYFYMYGLYYAQGVAFFIGSFCFDVVYFLKKKNNL